MPITTTCGRCEKPAKADNNGRVISHIDTGLVECITPMPAFDPEPAESTVTEPTLETRYLVETSYEGERHLRVFDADGLARYLAQNIERNHYTGEADTLHGIYRYESGELAERVMVANGQYRLDDDFIDYNYRLHSKADAEGFGACDDNAEFGFTVRIDGRA